MLKSLSRFILSRILVVNENFKPPVIMTQSIKTQLVEALTDPERENRHAYVVYPERRHSKYPTSDILAWHIILKPKRNVIREIAALVDLVRAVDDIPVISMHTDDGGRLLLL